MTKETFGIYHDLIINTSAENVFQAISEPEQLVNWWPLTCTGKPEKGAKYNFFFGEPYNWFGTVDQCFTNEFFSIKMTKADSDWDPTTFSFKLSEENGKTLLQFSHTNWQARNSHFRIASFCWAMLLKGLKDYIEKGVIIPFEERN